MTVRHDGLLVEWLGYATVRIQAPDGTVVYLDPGRYGVLDDYDAQDGDLVCVSHVHHYDTFEAIETDSGAFAADVAKRGIPVVLDERE